MALSKAEEPAGTVVSVNGRTVFPGSSVPVFWSGTATASFSGSTDHWIAYYGNIAEVTNPSNVSGSGLNWTNTILTSLGAPNGDSGFAISPVFDSAAAATETISYSFDSPLASSIPFLLVAPGAVNGFENGPFTFTVSASRGGSTVSTAGWSFSVQSPVNQALPGTFNVNASTGTITVDSYGDNPYAVVVITPNASIDEITVTAHTIEEDFWGLAFNNTGAAPPAPTNLGLSPDSDTGVKGDNTTSNTTPIITGVGEIGDTVRLFSNGGSSPIGQSSVGNNGSWTITTSALPAGACSLTANETDTAGNVSLSSAPLSITISGSTPPPPTKTIQDAWIRNSFDPESIHNDDHLSVGGWGDTYYALIRFDLTGKPTSATSATIRLFDQTSSNNTTGLTLYKITSAWDESSVTWNNQPGATLVGTLATPTPGSSYSIDITSLYNQWQSGTTPNFGIELRPTLTNNNNFDIFTSSDGSDATKRPSLAISTAAPADNLALAKLANDTYTNDTVIPAGFTRFARSSDEPAANPFYAEAFRNGNQIVVAIRGTAADTWSILINNVASWWSWNAVATQPDGVLDGYITDAFDFLHKKVESVLQPGDLITLTGHSLGGAIAQILGRETGYRTVTFDAPGTNQFQESSLHFDKSPLGDDGHAIENVRLAGDLVSTIGKQVGAVTTVDFNKPPELILDGPLVRHDFQRLIDSLTAGNTLHNGFLLNEFGQYFSPDVGVFNSKLGHSVGGVDVPYAGPVAGLSKQYVNVAPDPINVSVSSDNWFIHTGVADDAIAVHGGTNVLDGGTGSNFLVGGSGTDTFFVDDRGPKSDIWSTVTGFHAGDAATIWGVTPAQFNTQWVDGEGAAGFAGLTLHATASGKPTASLTLSGYNTSDLTNGRLSTIFGTDPVSTSPYLYVFGNH